MKIFQIWIFFLENVPNFPNFKMPQTIILNTFFLFFFINREISMRGVQKPPYLPPSRPGRGEKLSAREVRLLRTPFASSTAPRPSTARPRGRVCSRGLQVAHTLFDDLSGCVLGFVHISSKFCLLAVITIAFSNASTGQ